MVFITAVLVLTEWLNLGAMLLAILFSYYAIQHLNFFKARGRWPAIVLYLALLGGAAYGVASFVQATASALPAIAEKALPAIVQWAQTHHIRLPFTDMASLKDQALQLAQHEAGNIGKFANFAQSATRQFIYISVGCLVAIGLFWNPALEIGHVPGTDKDNFYSICCKEIGRVCAAFYESFAIVMNAQVIIALLNTALVAAFMAVLGLPHLFVAIGVSFVCGLLPFIGPLISSLLVVAIGFTVSADSGLAALGFSVLAHYLEFILGSKIIGHHIQSPLWVTLLALVIGEQLMGITGIVLAPVVLHYLRLETSRIKVNK